MLPADDESLGRSGVAHLAQLASAVLCVGPELRGNAKPIVQARVLVARDARAAGIGSGETARCLGVTTQAANRLAKRDLDPRAVSALRRRLALEERIYGAGGRRRAS